jgi:hypothetical protein
MSKEKSQRRDAERKALEALTDRSTRMGCAGIQIGIVILARPRQQNGRDCKNDMTGAPGLRANPDLT